MNALLDLIVVAVFITVIVVSAKRGLVKSLLSLLCIVVAFLVAQNFSAPLGEYLEKEYFGPLFADKVAVQLGSVINEQGTSEEILQGSSFSKLIEDAPSALNDILQSWGTDLETIGKSIADAGSSATEAINKFIADTIIGGASSVISVSIAFLLLFLASYAVCNLILLIVDAACKLPVLKTFNKIGGALFGIVKGGIISIIIAMIICFASPYISHNGEQLITEDTVEATLVFKYLTPQTLFSEKSPSEIYDSMFHTSADAPSDTPTLSE